MATLTDNFSALGTMTITLAALGNSATGVGRVSDYVDNASNKYVSAMVHVKITTGTAATANTPVYLYLSRSNNSTLNDDGNGTVDAAGTFINTPLLGVINVSGTTVSAAYTAIFDTTPLGPLGPAWGVGVVNNSGFALNGTAGEFLVTYIGVTKTIA